MEPRKTPDAAIEIEYIEVTRYKDGSVSVYRPDVPYFNAMHLLLDGVIAILNDREKE